MVANNCWPLPVPQRRFGGVVMTRVAYASHAFGPIGWLVRHGRRGAPPLEARRIASDASPAFDHAEAWLRFDEQRKILDDRVLIGHPYRFDEELRAALVRAAVQFGFAWTAIPPGSPPGVSSWYDRNAWLIIAHPRHLLPIPELEEIPSWRQKRRLLKPGEFVTDLQLEMDAEKVESAKKSKIQAKRDYNRARYNAQKAKKNKPLSLGDILANPERARARVLKQSE